MKTRILVAFLFCLSVFSIQSQNRNGFGFKGGLNYSANGNYFNAISANAEQPDRNIGFHFGVFGKIGKKVFFKPELVYTKTKSDYNSESFNIQKLDAPLLVGVNFFRIVNVFAGPSIQYIIESDFGSISVDSIKNDFTVGLNFGLGITLNKIGIDLRYERGFNSNEATFIENNSSGALSRIDTRPDQLILSLSLLL